MPRIRGNLQFSISDSSTGGDELGKTSPGLWYFVNDQQTAGGTFAQIITASATNVSISLLGLTSVTFVAINSDQEITVAFNSTSNPVMTLAPLGVGAPNALWVGTVTDITAIYVSNPGAINANVIFTLAGV